MEPNTTVSGSSHTSDLLFDFRFLGTGLPALGDFFGFPPPASVRKVEETRANLRNRNLAQSRYVNVLEATRSTWMDHGLLLLRLAGPCRFRS